MDESIITITKAAAGTTLLGASVYLIKRGVEEKFAEIKARREAFSAHIKACTEKNTHIALLDQKVEGLLQKSEKDGCERQWLGDCVVAIAAKMNVRLPERP